MGSRAPNKSFDGLLKHDYIHFRNEDQFQNDLQVLIESGAEKCMIVWDFDYTMTKEFNELGKRQNNSFGAFASCSSIPANVKTAMWENIKKYTTYEKDDDSCEQNVRKKKLDEWCNRTNDLFRNVPFDWKDITTVIENVEMRSSTFETFLLAKQLHIPSFIISGGHGDCITRIITRAGIQVDNYPVTIISNFLKRKQGLLDGFKYRMVHALNKEECLKDNPKYKENSSRSNIILIGDSLADADMVGKLDTSVKNILKIGFYNNRDHNLLEKYLQIFDVVLLESNSMDFVCELLGLIAKT